MSSGAPTIQHTAISVTSAPNQQGDMVDIPTMVDTADGESGTRMWEQINKIIASPLRPAGSGEFESRNNSLVTVAPGIAMSAAEYHERFGDIDLEHFKGRMSPRAYGVLVRYMGLIPGDPDLDVTQIATMPE